LRKMSWELGPIVAVRVAQPIGLLKSIDKSGYERFDPLLGKHDAQNLNLCRISHLAKVVNEAGVPAKTKLVI
jgi:hypothetical protein